MSRVACLVAAVSLAAGCCRGFECRMPPPTPPPVVPPAAVEVAPVAAKRYRTWIVEGALEATHGGGRWIEELWFPERGIVANVTWDLDTSGKDWTWKPTLNAFHGPARNSFRKGFHDANDTVTALEETSVPASLARAIFEAADLGLRLDAARSDLGSRLEAGGVLNRIDAGGP